jgi:hypothetical protein
MSNADNDRVTELTNRANSYGTAQASATDARANIAQSL